MPRRWACPICPALPVAAGGSRPADHGGELIEDPWQAFNSANACTEAK